MVITFIIKLFCSTMFGGYYMNNLQSKYVIHVQIFSEIKDECYEEKNFASFAMERPGRVRGHSDSEN